MHRTGCLLLFAAIAVFGQAPPAPPQFEVASIKPSDPLSTMAIRRSGDRLIFTNYSLKKLITWAYDIPDDRLFGEPKFLDSAHYDVAAQGDGEYRLMMQSLLASRFHLAIHRETRERSVLLMVVDRKGAKIHPVESDEPIGQNPFAGSRTGLYRGTKVTTGMLAKALSDILDRAVEDSTGLKGQFDFTLQWATDTDTAKGPSIYTALQEQLGLRLESHKSPVEAIVIDHIDATPTEN